MRPRYRSIGILGLGLALAAAANVASAETAPPQDAPLRLTAFAVDLNRPGIASTTTLDIVIERWSKDAELRRLQDVLVEKGGGGPLLSALQKIQPRAGFVRSTNSLGWDIQLARQIVHEDGSRRIVLASDRPMSFWEAAGRPRSSDYEFMLAEIRLDKEGKGEGKLVPAASVKWNQETRALEIENYEAYPVRLMQVTVVKAGK